MKVSKTLRIAIYSPYLDTLGGGERYMMTIAEVLSDQNYNVDVCLDNHLFSLGGENLKKELSKRFNLNLANVNFIKAPLGKGSSYFPRFNFLKKYDLLFYLTDGSIFYPSSKRNILHIQSPLVGEPAKSLWGKIKLKGWNLIIYNSEFTKKNSQPNWPIESQVIYPPVDVDKIKPLKKKKNILSVGRFFGFLKDKKHQVLIEAFKELYQKEQIIDCSLHLVGSAAVGDRSYIDELKKLAEDLPINFYPNLEYNKLVKLYGESIIYWHASGFGEKDPTKMEHFGITTCEAMAAGCVPIVIKAGGQKEIVEQGKSGFLWDKIEELIYYTKLVTENSKIFDNLSSNAISRSRLFSKDKFQLNIKKVIFMLP